MTQLDAKIYQVYLLDVYVQLSMFWAPPRPLSVAYQLKQQSLVYRRNMVVAALLVMVWPVNQPDHDQQHCYRHATAVKPEATNAVVSF